MQYKIGSYKLPVANQLNLYQLGVLKYRIKLKLAKDTLNNKPCTA